jgi:hypothetical protein
MWLTYSEDRWGPGADGVGTAAPLFMGLPELQGTIGARDSYVFIFIFIKKKKVVGSD